MSFCTTIPNLNDCTNDRKLVRRKRLCIIIAVRCIFAQIRLSRNIHVYQRVNALRKLVSLKFIDSVMLMTNEHNNFCTSLKRYERNCVELH